MANIIGSVFQSGAQYPAIAELERFTFLTHALQAPMLTDGLGIDVFSGIQWKEEAGTLTQPSKFTYHQEGCNPTYTNLDKAISERSIYVHPTNVNLEQCLTVFDKTYWGRTLAKGRGIFSLEQADAVLQDFINKIILTGLMEDLIAKFYFGDTDSLDTFYSKFDGIFKIIEDDAVAARKFAVAAPATAGNGIVAFQTAYEKQSIEMYDFDANDKIYKVTRPVYDALVRDMSTTDTSFSTQNIYKDAQNGLFYRGIEVVCMPVWDKVIARDFAISGADGDPNRILLTVRMNEILGTDVEGDMTVIGEPYYDGRTKTNLLGADFKMGVQLKDPNLVVYGRS
jgi:hypothetical protein